MFTNHAVRVSQTVFRDSHAWLSQNYITEHHNYSVDLDQDFVILRFGYRPHWEMYLLRFGHLGAQNYLDR